MLAVDDLRQHLGAAGQFNLAEDIGNVTGPTGGRDSHDGEAEQDTLVAQINSIEIGGRALLAEDGRAEDRRFAFVAPESNQGARTGVVAGQFESLGVYGNWSRRWF